MNRWLSIIVPTYNGAPYLSECLHSVLDQLPEDFELIVVDDGSKDDTKIILEGFAGRQSNLQVCFCSHKGVSGARNTGLSLASGRYVVFLDGDDHLRPGILETVRPQLEADADLTIFGIERVFPAADPSGKYHAADLRPCFDANASRAVYLAVLSADRVSDPHSEPSPVQRLAPKGCASLGQRPRTLYLTVAPEEAAEASAAIRRYAQEHGASERMANLVGLCMEEMVAYPTALHIDTGIHTQIMVSFAKDHTRFMMLDDGRCTALDELPDSPLRPSTITSSSSASPRPWSISTS